MKLNEDDHQGIRYLLLETLFASKDYKQAELLLDKYSEDYSIEFRFGSVALNILQNKLQQAEKCMQDAALLNEFFIDEVIRGKQVKPLPYRIPGVQNLDAGVPIGSFQEAYDYWERNRGLYSNKKIISYFKSYRSPIAK
ncbi:hypothetical protein B0A81_18620 [Flavobacterium plurextorum]|uniref:Uncharacterized protein n=1 Tax=Flavobacterium plurextorum TaxID=1114867 RepID=A0ABX4CQ46_9FLAO|nr:hypothetical protein [Flavobacterium plurextorum]OXB03346.1 hypothetical protein B0A81_18620 [Flavobacterium plurextorum]